MHQGRCAVPRGASVLCAQEQMLRTIRHSAEAEGASIERKQTSQLQSPKIWYKNTCVGVPATGLLSAISGWELLRLLLLQLMSDYGGGARGGTSSRGMVSRA